MDVILFWSFVVVVVLVTWTGYSSSGDAPDWLCSPQGLAKKQLKETRRTNQLMAEQRQDEYTRWKR